MTPLQEAESLLVVAAHATQFRTVVSRSYYAAFRRLVGVSRPLGFSTEAPNVHARLQAFLRGRTEVALRRIGMRVVRDLFELRVKADYKFGVVVARAEAENAVYLAQVIHDWIDDANLQSEFR